ncbi:hypothetical protein AB4Y35_18280 [Paraburkholderia sp. EG286A]|uniref:hypothetical protein n=1 Tax=Paraburkholderia sp. EG286A TaxID=3237014 RepID=UPI0034D37ABE
MTWLTFRAHPLTQFGEQVTLQATFGVYVAMANQTQQEMLLAFQLNHPRIARAIKQKTLPQNGCRVVLEAADFVAQPRPPSAAEATSLSNDSGLSGLDAEND